MGLFRRRRTGRHADDRPDPAGSVDDETLEDFIGGLSAGSDDEDEDGYDADDDEDGDAADRAAGPYDAAEAPDDDVVRVDLGSMQVPAPRGVQLRVQADDEGRISDVILTSSSGTLQLAAFAAPRTDGIWDDIRADLKSKLTADGGRVTETTGEYGPELRARVRTADGPTDMRVVGIDGPRWFVRAVFKGRAATDPQTAAELTECLEELVVTRGGEAMPVREALPLQLPTEGDANIQTDAPGSGRAGARPSAGRVNSTKSQQSRKSRKKR